MDDSSLPQPSDVSAEVQTTTLLEKYKDNAADSFRSDSLGTDAIPSVRTSNGKHPHRFASQSEAVGASFSKEKFDFYFNAAQVYLKQGRYYRAADSFTLASIFGAREEVGLAYAGKSHALFAAGEYISSALFLSRALQVMPDYASVKVDLVDIIGGKDKLEARIADAEERLQISDAPELRFLLAYVYYQMDKLDAAKKAIDAAYKKLPNSKAIGALKKAIDSALAGNQPTIQ